MVDKKEFLSRVIFRIPTQQTPRLPVEDAALVDRDLFVEVVENFLSVLRLLSFLVGKLLNHAHSRNSREETYSADREVRQSDGHTAMTKERRGWRVSSDLHTKRNEPNLQKRFAGGPQVAP